MNPGSNLLARALTRITPQPYQYYAFLQRVNQPNGLYLTTYAAPLNLQGSVQSPPTVLLQELGLDWQRNYKLFYVKKQVMDVDRDVSGDLLLFANRLYQCLSTTDWFAVDGWVSVLAVQVPNTPLVTQFSAPQANVLATEDDITITTEDGQALSVQKDYVTGDPITFVVTFNQNVIVTGDAYIPLSGLDSGFTGNAVYVSGSGTAELTFTYTVQAGGSAIGILATSPVVGDIANAAAIQANTSFVQPDLSWITLN